MKLIFILAIFLLISNDNFVILLSINILNSKQFCINVKILTKHIYIEEDKHAK